MDIHDNIASTIKERGIDDPVCSESIRQHFGINDRSGTSVTRALILQTMQTKEIPIGACRRGYFLIKNRIELEEYVENLQGRVDKILERIALVRACYDKNRG